MFHSKKIGELQINWKSVRRKYPDISTYRAISKKLRQRIRVHSQNLIRHGDSDQVDTAEIKERNKKYKNTVSTLADILEDFIVTEKKKLDEYKLTHAPSIGKMYEGLTGEFVNKIMPSNLDLRIVNGFIVDDSGYLSGEIDRMLVQGQGEEVPYSNGQYKYHIKDVLVIFEVKKTLRTLDFVDAYNHLKSISMAYSDYFDKCLEKGNIFNIKYPSRIFSKITGKPEPRSYSDIHNMAKEDAIIFYTLVQACFSPVTIIHSFDGYKTEAGLRRVLINFLEKNQKESGFGVPSLPSLISSSHFSIVKLTGIPFNSPQNEDNSWTVLASSRDNIAYLIVEMIWTKISIFSEVSMPWGDDMKTDIFITLLNAKYGVDAISKREGWIYNTVEYTETVMKNVRREDEWSPIIVSALVNDIIQSIGLFGALNLDSEIIIDSLTSYTASQEELLRELRSTNLFAIGTSGLISIIGVAIHVVEIDKEKYAISDDVNRLTNWCSLHSIDNGMMSYCFTDKL